MLPPRLPLPPSSQPHRSLHGLYSCQYRPVNPQFLQDIVHDLKDCVDSLADQSTDKIVRLDAAEPNPETSWRGWSHEQDRQSRRVCQFPVLTEKTCNELITEVENIRKHFHNAPLDHDGIVLNKFGFSRRMHYFARLLSPVLRQVYQLPESYIVQTTQALVVKYQPGDSHCMHVDDSAYTLNICLGQEFTGGRLCFYPSDAAKLTPDEQATMQPELAVQHYPGHGILHNGNIPHSALKLLSGARYNLVLWFRVHTTFNSFEKVPLDVRRVVIARLSLPDLVNFSSTSKAYRNHCRHDQSLWRYHYRCRFPSIYPNFPSDGLPKDKRPVPHPSPPMPRPKSLQPVLHESYSLPPPRVTPSVPRGRTRASPRPNVPTRGSNPNAIPSPNNNSSPITTEIDRDPDLFLSSVSPLFHYPILERNLSVIDASEEDRISEHTRGRDWYLFLVDAVYLDRRNRKTRVEEYYGSSPPFRASGVSLEHLPESLQSVRDHRTSTETRSSSEYTCTVTKPKQEYNGPPFHLNPRMISKRGPPSIFSYYDEGVISPQEVVEFYEVAGWEASVDFSKPENRISYGTASNNNS